MCQPSGIFLIKCANSGHSLFSKLNLRLFHLMATKEKARPKKH